MNLSIFVIPYAKVRHTASHDHNDQAAICFCVCVCLRVCLYVFHKISHGRLLLAATVCEWLMPKEQMYIMENIKIFAPLNNVAMQLIPAAINSLCAIGARIWLEDFLVIFPSPIATNIRSSIM